MPYKFDKIPINNENLDRRVKLTQRKKKNIIRLHMEDGLSTRKLAKKYRVSRRTIQFVLDPKKLEENLKRRDERGGSKVYHDTEKQRVYMKNHRDYKKELYKNNLIK